MDVSKRTFYHVNRSIAYSPYPLMVVGQQLDTSVNNPFFQYYDTHVPRHAVTLADQSVVHLGIIKFLNAVRTGEVNPNNLAVAAHDGARHFMMLARELLFENIRIRKYPDLPSREKALWFVEDLKELAYWKERLAKEQPTIPTQFVEVEATGKMHRCDASLLVADSERVSDSLAKGEKYWSGAMEPIGSEPEVLFEGTATVKKIIDPSSF